MRNPSRAADVGNVSPEQPRDQVSLREAVDGERGFSWS